MFLTPREKELSAAQKDKITKDSYDRAVKRDKDITRLMGIDED